MSAPRVARRVVLLAVVSLAVLPTVGGGAGAAAPDSKPPCVSQIKGIRALCKGTATVHVGSKSTHYSAVTCYIDASNTPQEVWKVKAFLLKMSFVGHDRKSHRAGFLAYAGASAVSATVVVKLAASRRSGTFSGHAVVGKTVVSGSFVCK